MTTKRTAMIWLLGHVAYRGTECLLWPFSCDNKGYAQVGIGKSKVAKANRVMCGLAHGNAPTPKHQAAHLCGKRNCVNPKHLAWKTQSENEADKTVHGTKPRQWWGRRGKLTKDQRRHIQVTKTAAPELAARFGVRRETIDYWRRQKTTTASR